MTDKLMVDWAREVAIIEKHDGRIGVHPFSNILHYLEELKNEPGFIFPDGRERMLKIIEEPEKIKEGEIRTILIAKGYLDL